MAGRKRFEFRLGFRRLACASAREGDRLLLKRSGGEVEAACDIGEVRFYRKLPPEVVAALAHRYADGVSAPYFERYVAPNNPDRPVNLAEAKIDEQMARLESLRQRFHPEADEDQAK